MVKTFILKEQLLKKEEEEEVEEEGVEEEEELVNRISNHSFSLHIASKTKCMKDVEWF